MARYFFHTDCGLPYVDGDGSELPTLNAARRNAAELVAAVLQDGSDAFWSSKPWTLSVTDSAGVVLFTIQVRGEDGPTARANVLQFPPLKS